MKTQLLKDLQELQHKADNAFKEAQKDNSEHGAGFFFLAKKIDKIIGYITGAREGKKSVFSLTERRKELVEIAENYTKITGITYPVELEVKISALGEITYSCNVSGITKNISEDKYSSPGRIYSADSFEELKVRVIEIFEKEKEARSDNPVVSQDVAVK